MRWLTDDEYAAFCAIETRIAALEAQLAEWEWRPIESAPKDASMILLSHSYLGIKRTAVGFWDGSNGCHNAYGFGFCRPTHWMPLPQKPKEPTP